MSGSPTDAGASFAVRAARLCLALCASLLALALAGETALSATGHNFLQSLSEAPPGSPLSEPGTLAVDRASGRLFVADPGRGVIDVFSSSGSYETSFGENLAPAELAVDEASGEVYVAEPFEDVVFVFKPDGKGGYVELSEWLGLGISEEGFGEVSGVAVDNSSSASDPHAGDVFVVDSENAAVDIFKPEPAGPEEADEGAFVGSLSGEVLEEPNGIALDSSTGRAYVADSVLGAIYVYSPSASLERKLGGSGQPGGGFFGPEEEEGNVSAIAIDEASGELYVAEAERRVLSQFNAEGKWIGWVTTGEAGSALAEPRGVAVAPTGDLYLADAAARVVDVFGPDVTVPDATTKGAAKTGKTSATLRGIVNGDGEAAEYSFQWGESEALGHETTVLSGGPGEEEVSAELSALTAGATYYFRLKAENANGTNYGQILEFQTKPAVEGLATGAVQSLAPTEATLTGTLNPRGTETHYYFQWGTSAAYGKVAPESPGDAGAGKGEVQVSAPLSGLVPNTTYHFRLVGEDEFGTTFGEDRQFTTSGPPRLTIEAASVPSFKEGGHYAATLHAKVNPDELETKYSFEYGETTAYGTQVPPGGGPIPAGSVPVAESAALSELKIGTTYHFRVVGENEAGRTTGPDQTFTTVPAALIESEFASSVSASEATLKTQINPLGQDTTYFFEYGTQPCEENPGACTNVPATPADIGDGEAGVLEQVRLEGLVPSTTYHYRVLAANPLGTAAGPERSFTTEQAEAPFALPDGRVWEMVSPVDKHGAPIEALTREGGLVLASEDGNSLTYVADGAASEEPEGNRSPEMQQLIARRGEREWTSRDIDTPQSRAQGLLPGATPEYQFFTPDLSQALVQPVGNEPPLAPEATQKTLYLRDNENATYTALVTEANVLQGTQFGSQLSFVSATPDLSHVVFRSVVQLTEAPSGPGLYEWQAGKLTFLSLEPLAGETSCAGASCVPATSSSLGFEGHVLAHAISSDGSRVIWADKGEGTGQGHLFMRDTANGETLQLDAAQGTPEPEKGSAQFQSANPDGSRVFFTDRQKLTPDANPETGLGGAKADLYECEVQETGGKLSCRLRDLTIDRNEGEHAAVQGFLLGTGEAGNSIFLIARGVLAANEDGNGERAEANKDNLYALAESAGEWHTTFIAQLSAEDSPEWEGGPAQDTAFLTARVSPNGRYLAFMSAASPTGYDNVDQNSGARDEEVYLYDLETSSLRCVSCNPTGARPLGVFDTVESGEGLGLLVDRRKVWAELGKEHWLAGSIPGWTAQSITTALFQSRYLSDNGRLYFDSADALVPGVVTRTRKEQVNNTEMDVGVENVYEYEPSGVGDCQSASGGCVSLISSGASGKESTFLEATPDASNVFFLTASQLLPQDTDTAFDVYDARVCTQSSPCLAPPPPPAAPCASTEVCHPASPSQVLPLGPSGSATFSGPGNLTPAPSIGKLGSKTTTKPKPLTRAQKLARALKACRRIKAKKKRHGCERRARKAYGAKHKGKKSKARRPRRRSTKRSRR
jgi:DNA-binding beta-propeller fold protein YncE